MQISSFSNQQYVFCVHNSGLSASDFYELRDPQKYERLQQEGARSLIARHGNFLAFNTVRKQSVCLLVTVTTVYACQIFPI